MVTRAAYRDAMARFGAAVSVVTTDGPHGRFGFTASAVCSVTDAPPTLLVCVNRANDSHRALLGNGVLCVNTLAAGQADLSVLFSASQKAHAERFAGGGEWTTLVTGAPVLADCVVSFDCRMASVTEVGTHTVMFAEVVGLQHGTRHDALIYFGRDYHPVRHKAVA